MSKILEEKNIGFIEELAKLNQEISDLLFKRNEVGLYTTEQMDLSVLRKQRDTLLRTLYKN